MSTFLLKGDCLEVLQTLDHESVDSLVTDPPAGISFMGKEWDSAKGGRKDWCAWMESVMREAMRVMKPGAHGLVWAIPRTSHWTATALEDAGFEIRDVVTHLFGSGFPKSLDVSKAIDKAAGAERKVIGAGAYASRRVNSNGGNTTGAFEHDGHEVTAPATDAAKQWAGWGTALKPASEHWILVRKPCSEKTVAANVQKWGTGAINIDASRIGVGGHHGGAVGASKSEAFGNHAAYIPGPNKVYDQGRFPANLVLSGDAVEMLGEPARFFYCAKISTSERNAGLEHLEPKDAPLGDDRPSGQSMSRLDGREARKAQNTHPTVKPKKLMAYLIRMITPPGGIVLDPFMGSGSTGIAAKECGFGFIGIEREKEYFEIAEARIASVKEAAAT